MAQFEYDPTDAETEALIESKAVRLCRQPGFTSSDREDVEQDLRLHLIIHGNEFDPAKQRWINFVSFILDNVCASLCRQRHAAKRSRAREEFSLDEIVGDGEGGEVPRHATTPEASYDPELQQDLALDIADVMSRMPDHARVVGLELARGTPNAVNDQTGIPRRTVSRAIEKLRESLRNAGLDPCT